LESLEKNNFRNFQTFGKTSFRTFPNFFRTFPNFFRTFSKLFPNFLTQKQGFFRKISGLRQPNFSETRENEKFRKSCLTQGLNYQNPRFFNFVLSTLSEFISQLCLRRCEFLKNYVSLIESITISSLSSFACLDWLPSYNVSYCLCCISLPWRALQKPETLHKLSTFSQYTFSVGNGSLLKWYFTLRVYETTPPPVTQGSGTYDR